MNVDVETELVLIDADQKNKDIRRQNIQEEVSDVMQFGGLSFFMRYVRMSFI